MKMPQEVPTKSATLRWAVIVLALLLVSPFTQAQGSWFTGITEPIMDVTMGFPIVGTLATRAFEEGASVKKGDVVAGLDRRLEDLDVERKKLARDLARIELDRVKTLAQKNAISVSREEVDKKQAEFEIASVEHQLASEVVQRRLLVSPLDGYVAQHFKQVGEACHEQQDVLRLVDTRHCYLVANVDSKFGATLKEGQPVKVAVEIGGQEVQFSGVLSFVSPVVDPASGLLRIKSLFENKEGRVKPGIAGKVQVEPRP